MLLIAYTDGILVQCIYVTRLEPSEKFPGVNTIVDQVFPVFVILRDIYANDICTPFWVYNFSDNCASRAAYIVAADAPSVKERLSRSDRLHPCSSPTLLLQG
jgi:hypothetical protein